MSKRRRRKGTGSLSYDASRKRWIGSVDVGTNPRTGKRQRRRVSAASRQGARQLLDQLIERQQEGQDLRNRPTVGSVWRLWMDRSGHSPSTAAMYHSLGQTHLLPVLGDRPIADVTIEEVEAWLDARSKLSRSTLQKLRNMTAQVFDMALRRRMVSSNPARLALMPTDPKPAKRGRSLTSAEASRMLEASSGHRLGAYVVLALFTGARPGELTALQWADLDLDAATVTIRATKTKTARVLRLGEGAITALREHRRRQADELSLLGDRWPPSHLVFRSEAGTRIDRSNLRRVVRSIAEEASIDWPVTPYTLRHSHASLLSAEGVHAELLADRLGHKDSRTTLKYYRHPVSPVVEAGADFTVGPQRR